MKIKGEVSTFLVLLNESFQFFTFCIRKFEELVDHAWEKMT